MLKGLNHNLVYRAKGALIRVRQVVRYLVMEIQEIQVHLVRMVSKIYRM